MDKRSYAKYRKIFFWIFISLLIAAFLFCFVGIALLMGSRERLEKWIFVIYAAILYFWVPLIVTGGCWAFFALKDKRTKLSGKESGEKFQ